MKSSSAVGQGGHKRKFSSEDYEWLPSGYKKRLECESNYSSDSSETVSAPSSPEPEFSYRSVICPKTKNKYVLSSTHSFDFISKIQSRIEVKSLDGFVKAQCRICGVNPKKCLNIFEDSGEISKIVNTFLPIKVSREDMFPNFMCLECLGVLQAMDDLAYRAYLVEVCFRQYGMSTGVDRSSKIKLFSEQKENIETVSGANLNSPKAPNEDHDSSQDTIDCNLLVPEVNLRTSSEPLQFGNHILEHSAARSKIFIYRKNLRVPLNQTENKTLERNLSWHSYAKPFSEAAVSEEDAEKCAEVTGSDHEPSTQECSQIPRAKIITSRLEKLLSSKSSHSYTKPSEDTTEQKVVLKEKTQLLSNSSGIAGTEETRIDKSVIPSHEKASPDMSLHSYAKSVKNAAEESVELKETAHRPSGMFKKTQTHNGENVTRSQERVIPKVSLLSRKKPAKNTMHKVVLKEKTQLLSKLLVIGGTKKMQNGKSDAPIQEKVPPNVSLHSYAKPAKDATEKKVVARETAKPLSELLKIGKTEQVVTMEKFTQLISDITSARADFSGKSNQVAGKKNKHFMLQVSKVKRKLDNGLIAIAPRPDGQKVTPPDGQKVTPPDGQKLTSPPDGQEPTSLLNGQKPTPQPQVVQKKKERLLIHGCYVCNKKFGEYQHLLSHMHVSHLPVDKSCPVCEKVFDQASIQPLLGHRKIHSAVELKKWTNGSDVRSSIKCETCSKFFISRIQKIYHDIYHHQLSLCSCEFCDAECLSSVSLEKHRKMCAASSESFKKACHVCFAVFKNPTDLKQHVEGHEERYTCDYCFTPFMSSRLLEDHVQVDHAEKPYSCELCGKSFVIEPMLTRHQQSFHSLVVAQADMSVELSRSESADLSSSKSVDMSSSKSADTSSSKPRFSCAACDAVFSSRLKYKQHRKTHNFDKRRKCSICGQVFPSISEINIHRCQEHKEFTCKICGCNCSSIEKLHHHTARCMARRGERKPKDTNAPRVTNWQPKKRRKCVKYTHECQTCGRKFGDKSSLRSHETIHTGERPFMCAVCGKTFRTKELHFTHSKRHTDVKQYACPFCDLTFRRMDQLYTHKRTKHLEQFKYHCKVCNRSYMSPKYFIMHMQMCTSFSQPPVELDRSVMRCLVCPQFFHSEVSLKNHEKCMHDLDYPPICGLCFERFPNVNSLKNHLETHYNNNEIKDIVCPYCKKTCADSHEFRIHPCSNESSSVGSNSDSAGNPSPEETVSLQQAGRIEDKSDTQDASESPPSPVSASLSKLVTGSDETNSLDEYVDMLNRTKFTSEDAQKGNTGGTEKSNDGKILPLEAEAAELAREKSSLNPQNIDKNEKEKADRNVPAESLNNITIAGMIYQCTFCQTDFYDNHVFLFHLKNEHNLELDSLNFQIKE